MLQIWEINLYTWLKDSSRNGIFIKGIGDSLELREVGFLKKSDMGYADLKIQKQKSGQMSVGASHSIIKVP